ncbi:hypothetical protein GUITHDRAFT_147483 [Guillardia theta CCMP2712]|uniref:Leucine-rich repeat-containing N-terminal plant-type domain-containing protein n=1 Tax=Guillardia theta (strain CCMP2712) TaxID=905079 RepID=L1ICV8_GUITC|nr:hypothetical protein GUITHDRAFT_147483 [Guillardia theta CCMP2712]EKX34086.1 hypothetical protein GUITHDRAFT_147483 [Guillardia theta CCMP2712]|eukprot:XP_005821066.1 hypothetical protein GUITHDRAFT_147483 [Guillardia theta CCMP2712]
MSSWLLLYIIVLALASSSTAYTISDCSALVSFYQAMTVNTKWTTSTGWVTTDDCCSWYGVTCSYSTRNGTGFGPWVSALQLPNNQLSGYLPSSFSLLSRLERLDLSHNKVKGDISVLLQMKASSVCIDTATSQIPDTVFESACNSDLNCLGGVCSVVGGLKEIRLSDNMLNGTIGEEISNLFKTLTILDLSANELTGPIPAMIGTLTQLVELNLYYNQLRLSNSSGPIPEMIGMLVKLKYLNVAFNLLNGTLPSQNLPPV